jgi:hypothetical protein
MVKFALSVNENETKTCFCRNLSQYQPLAPGGAAPRPLH